VALAAELSREELEEANSLVDELARRGLTRKLFGLYPDEGPLRRELYRQHLAFFRLGATCSTRAAICANRVGKTEGMGGYELVLHLIGRYPKWWEGRRFDKATDWWAAGDTHTTTRDIIQRKLLGPWGAFGTGLIPGDRITKTTPKNGVPEAVESIHVKSDFGGTSILTLKSYDQGRLAFQGTEKDGIWLDEEPPDEGIRAECMMRLMTTSGLMIETFTPLKGITPIVGRYVNSKIPMISDRVFSGTGIGLVMAGWDDVPHLSDVEKARMLGESEPHLRKARSQGIPSMGSGAIYPIEPEELAVRDFPIPPHWPRVYSLDVGWNRTAVVWGAWDRDTDTVYLYSEYYRGQAEPAIHAQAVKTRGEWIPGVVDPAARGRTQNDGKKMLDLYRQQGLELIEADNSVEAGILEVWQRMSTGRLKVFKSLQSWFAEFKMYRRDEKGKIVKENDHLMDDTRYLVMSGLKRARVAPVRRSSVPVYSPRDPGMGY